MEGDYIQTGSWDEGGGQADLMARVFKQKLDVLLKYLITGKVTEHMAVIEW